MTWNSSWYRVDAASPSESEALMWIVFADGSEMPRKPGMGWVTRVPPGFSYSASASVTRKTRTPSALMSRRLCCWPPMQSVLDADLVEAPAEAQLEVGAGGGVERLPGARGAGGRADGRRRPAAAVG